MKAVVEDSTGGVAQGDRVRFIVRSYETAAISAEINARITFLPKHEGDRFHKDDVLVEFDCQRISADYDAGVAQYQARKAAYDSQRRMQAFRFAGSLTVDQAYFDMVKAEADKRGLDSRRSGCRIRAPFDGRVAEKAAQVYEVAQPNQPLIKIINESKLELVLIVPSRWLSKLGNGTPFAVTLDENHETHAARIVQATGLIDPVSQSARLIAELVEPPASIVPGMSGTADFSTSIGNGP